MKIVGATGLVGLWALEWAWQSFFLDQPIGIIHFSENVVSSITIIIGRHRLGRFVGVRVGVACAAYKATEYKSEIPILYL